MHGPAPTVTIFRQTGESQYALEVTNGGIVLSIDRLRRERHELTGELSVKCALSGAQAIDGYLSIADFNLSSAQARTTRAKLLLERSGAELPWALWIEELCQRVIRAERNGDPSVGMTDIEPDEETSPETWSVAGLPLLSDLPLVIFGDAAAAKSYLALWIAGTLAQRDIPVLYLDWEFSGVAHRERLSRLFRPMPSARLLRYRRCDRPLVRILDGVLADIGRWSIGYVICDSIGFAIEGSAIEDEAATRYFGAARRFNCGSLHLAHIAKHQIEGQQPSIYGSNFFKAGARSAWYIERTTDNPANEIRVGLYHRKFNGGALQQEPLGYRVAFSPQTTSIEPIDLTSVDELAMQLPMLQRVRSALAKEPLTVKALAEDLASTPNIVRAVLAKHKSNFVRVGNKVGLLQPERELTF